MNMSDKLIVVDCQAKSSEIKPPTFLKLLSALALAYHYASLKSTLILLGRNAQKLAELERKSYELGANLVQSYNCEVSPRMR